MIILPVGIDKTKLFRLPWVTISIIGLCFLVWLLGSFNGDLKATKATRVVMRYFFEHPHLEMPEEFTSHLKRYGLLDSFRIAQQVQLSSVEEEEPGEYPADLYQQEQEQFESMVHSLILKHGRTFAQRWGVVPGDLNWPTLFTSIFVHAGLFHLLGNMCFLFFTGPFLEDRWGRPFFIAFFLSAGLFGGVLHILNNTQSLIPMVGASAAISGVLGAFLVKFTTRRFNFLIVGFFYFRVFHFEFSLPAWIVISILFSLDILMILTVGSYSPVAHWAHIGGFSLGLLTALFLRLSALEPRLNPGGFDPDYPELNLGEGAEYLEFQGKASKALELLGRGKLDELELKNLYWEMAFKHKDMDHMKKAAIPLFRMAIEQGDLSQALFLWRIFLENKTCLPLRSQQVFQFVSSLIEEERLVEATDVITRYLDIRATLSPAQLMELGYLAFRIDRPTVLTVCKYAKKMKTQTPEMQSKLMGFLEDALEPELLEKQAPEEIELSAEPIGRFEIDGIPFEIAEDGDIARLVENEEKEAEKEPGPSPKIISELEIQYCILTEINKSLLEIKLPSQKRINIVLKEISCMALTGIINKGQTKSLILDLALDDLHHTQPKHRILRIRSDQFDARRLVPGSSHPLNAFMSLARSIASSGVLEVSPHPEILKGKNIPMVSSEEAFTLKTYGII